MKIFRIIETILLAGILGLLAATVGAQEPVPPGYLVIDDNGTALAGSAMLTWKPDITCSDGPNGDVDCTMNPTIDMAALTHAPITPVALVPDPMTPATPYPHGDPCVDPVYYQRNIDNEWMIKGGTPGHTYQGGGNHAFTVINSDFLHYGVIGQGCTTCGYKKPSVAGAALDWWNKCFVSPRHISGYLCETAVVPTGTQVYQMRTLAQVTNPAKRASWAAQYGCNATPTPTPTPSAATPTPIPGGDPAARYIESLVNHGVTEGCGWNAQGRPIFCPDRAMTRREVAVWLVKAMGWTLSACVGAFADVPCQ